MDWKTSIIEQQGPRVVKKQHKINQVKQHKKSSETSLDFLNVQYRAHANGE